VIAAASGPGGGERARDCVEDEAHPETTAPVQAADGTAAEFERGGLVADEKRERSRPGEVLVAERGAEFAAFTQAGAGLFGVGFGDGRAHGEQAGRDEGWGADLAGQRERLVRQRGGCGRITGEQVTGRGEGELSGGVGEVAAGPRDAAACLARRAASAGAPVVIAMLERATQMVSSTRQSGVSRRALASAARRHSSSAPVTSPRLDANMAVTARASG
jgi:hypothetical protein